MRSVAEAGVAGKKVIVRCDFDVSVEAGIITEDIRIRKSSETLKFLLGKGARLFLISHLGRPENKDPQLSLEIVLPLLTQLLGREVDFQEGLNNQMSGEVVLLENLRYWPEEEADDENFAQKLANFGEVYVNECFSVAHRAHASVDRLPRLLPSYAGLELFREVSELERIFKNPEHPLLAIIGGAKIETKLPAINNVAKVADSVLVAGKLMFEIDKRGLPANVVVASDDIDKKDIGPESLRFFREKIGQAKMIVWNGPVGLFEEEKYQVGTRELAKSIAASSAYSIVGGGDTLAELDKEGLLDKIDFVSVGGGAMLEFLSGKELPALKALDYYG